MKKINLAILFVGLFIIFMLGRIDLTNVPLQIFLGLSILSLVYFVVYLFVTKLKKDKVERKYLTIISYIIIVLSLLCIGEYILMVKFPEYVGTSIGDLLIYTIIAALFVLTVVEVIYAIKKNRE